MKSRSVKQIALVAAVAIALLCGPPAHAQNPRLNAAVCQTLVAVRGSGPITSAAQLGAMLNTIAWKHRDLGLGLSKKDFGNFCSSPAGPIACDILQDKSTGMMWDVFGSAGVGEVTTPNCGDGIGPASDARRPWVAPVDPGIGPIDPPPSGELEKLKTENAQLRDLVALKDRRIAELEAQGQQQFEAIVELNARALNAETERDEARRQRDDVQRRLDNVSCTGQKILGFKTSCRVNR